MAATLQPIARAQAPVLDRLVQLYAHDFSAHMPLALGPDGRYDVSFGDRWWTDQDHHAFFVRWHDQLAGFALVRQGSQVTAAPDVMDVAEFFVVRGARRQGVGTQAAHALFETFPGGWEMRVRRTNRAAKTFWVQAAETFGGRPPGCTPYVKDGVDWDVIRLAGPLVQ